MNIKEFLQEPEIQELLEEENLSEIYEKMETYDRCHLTEFFINNNIKPLDYMSEVSPFMYAELDITDIKIPDNITSIGYAAFYSCDGLASITIPDSVTSISNGAFNECSSLEKVNITDIAAWCEIDFDNWDSNPLYYSEKLYLNDELVTELVIPDNVTSIGEYAFTGCRSLTSIRIPNNVTSIGEYAFHWCDQLKIKCKEKSYAHKYAIENSINFELI